jgi:hypothetical protein
MKKGIMVHADIAFQKSFTLSPPLRLFALFHLLLCPRRSWWVIKPYRQYMTPQLDFFIQIFGTSGIRRQAPCEELCPQWSTSAENLKDIVIS